MGKVISIFRNKNLGTGNIDYFNYKNGEPNPESEKIKRIKKSLNRINSLMIEIKNIKEHQDGRENSTDTE